MPLIDDSNKQWVESALALGVLHAHLFFIAPTRWKVMEYELSQDFPLVYFDISPGAAPKNNTTGLYDIRIVVYSPVEYLLALQRLFLQHRVDANYYEYVEYE